ncbi:hypothetical protein BGX34_004984 [Mortierella sp. NVP85]|nr:hypothetical protein BGX34_004984 [Mortierella sp. NVP85]
MPIPNSVALSATLDLNLEAKYNHMYTVEYLERARNKFIFKRSKEKAKPIQGIYLDRLKNSSLKQLIEDLPELRTDVLKDTQSKTSIRILNALDIICKYVERPPFHPGPAEANIVSHWENIFHQLLHGSDIYMRRVVDVESRFDQLCHTRASGECVSESSKDSRGILNNGWTAELEALYPFDGIFVTRNIGKLTLPSNEDTLKEFLKSDILDMIRDIVEHMKKSSTDLKNGRLEAVSDMERDIDTSVFLTHQRSRTPNP